MSYDRHNVNFRLDVREEAIASEFLSKCPRKSTSRIIAVALNNMIKEYNLEEKTPEEIAVFINGYLSQDVAAFMRMYNNTEHPLSNADEFVVTDKKGKKKDVEKEPSLVSSASRAIMSDIMAGFGLNT